MNKIVPAVASLILLSTLFAFAQRKPTESAIIAKLERDIPDLMQQASIPGMSAALIINGKMVWVHAFGVMNADTKRPITTTTLFEAASLTKVVVAYATLKLVDEDTIDLDVPLNKYLGNNYDVGDDPRLDKITARRVLSHTSGFPNWRSESDKPLPINYTPGEKFGYSGEGFVYLSKVIEKITGKTFTDIIQRMVFDPLDMKHSSLYWKEGLDSISVHRHDVVGNVSWRNEDKEFNAAASLRTTAEDYARLMIALLQGKGLKKETWQEMMTPQINVNVKSPQVFWGLGVGLEVTDDGKTFCHWGDQGDSKAFMAGRLKEKNGIVYFANSANGLSIAKEILDDALGGTHPSVDWLNYERYNSPGRTLLKMILQKGAKESLAEWRTSKNTASPMVVNEDQMNSVGYSLLRLKKTDDAIEVFKQNTQDYPQSSNVWDSLAEGYQTKGDKELAIQYYEKSLALNPDNKNGEEHLKQLRQK